MLSLGLPHVLQLQLKKCRYKRAASEAHWTSSSARAREGITYMRLTLHPAIERTSPSIVLLVGRVLPTFPAV